MTKKIKIAAILVGVVLIFAVSGSVVVYNSFFGTPQKQAEAERFIVPLRAEVSDLTELAALLKDRGFIKSERGFRIAYLGIGAVFTATTCVDCFSPGAYKISKSMTARELASVIKQGPYMKWVVIPEGLRKEQIADIIGNELGWDEAIKKEWVVTYTAMNYDEIEGVNFPDTYLIPKDESPLDVASRLHAKFNEEFEPYYKEAAKQNIKWDTLLKIASIVQREAAGKDDMPLIAGVVWNRLLDGMKLEIDATVQYVRDDVIHYGEARYDKQPTDYTSEGSWWTPIKTTDIDIASPYNTYRNKGLPPHPICNPGLDAINAVLNPAETKCFYYLHDSSRQIHCAKTYEEHQRNIEQFLK